jgi:aminoglycoside phosphotransferase (APT) family kinase protein
MPDRPDEGIVAAVLLERLRAEAGGGLEFVDPPVRLTGGFETFTYGFRVSAESGSFSGPLVLRVFRERGAEVQGRREAAFQNALAGLGYPVPRVVMQIGGPGIGGRPFNVMERVSGRPMMDEVMDGGGKIVDIPARLARVYARPHEVPSAPVIQAVERSGFSAEMFSIWHRLNWLDRYFEEPEFEGLRPVWDWLRDNRPAERETPAVCHGDFHPFNVMVDNGTVSGVIDWPGASFADAEYYEVMRTFIGFVRGTGALTPGVNPELLPRGGYPWADAWVMRQGAARIGETTGLAVPLPEGV